MIRRRSGFLGRTTSVARLLKVGIAIIVAMAVGVAVIVRSGLLAPGRDPVPIVGKPFAGQTFHSYPVTPQPLSGFAAQQILHPFVAFEGGGLQGNAYNSHVP